MRNAAQGVPMTLLDLKYNALNRDQFLLRKVYDEADTNIIQP
jgi:hypothetical protein